MSETTYSATLKIRRTVVAEEKRDRYDKLEQAASTTVTDVARVTITASTLDGLTAKIKAHSDLLPDAKATAG